jgi:hypothetical protein
MEKKIEKQNFTTGMLYGAFLTSLLYVLDHFLLNNLLIIEGEILISLIIPLGFLVGTYFSNRKEKIMKLTEEIEKIENT